MARASHVVVIALVMFAIIGMACAADAPRPSEDDYELDEDAEFMTGATVGAPSPNSVVLGPIGGPIPPGAFEDIPPASPPTAAGAASSLQHLSVIGTAATAALVAFFYL